MRRMLLDHITVADVTPARLAALAAETGCAGICAFLHSMDVLPAMPEFDLVRDAGARRETRAALDAHGVTLDMVYPFTLAGRTVIAGFADALEAAAELGAPLANVLCYDRDPARMVDRLGELADLAQGFGIALAVEFYSPSRIGSLAEAFALLDQLGREDLGVTLDLLHLMRAGEMPGALERLGDPRIRIAQFADGPASVPPERLEWEAGVERMLPGQGMFDIARVAAALAPGVPFSVETPRQSAIDAGTPPIERARAAVSALRTAISDA